MGRHTHRDTTKRSRIALAAMALLMAGCGADPAPAVDEGSTSTVSTSIVTTSAAPTSTATPATTVATAAPISDGLLEVEALSDLTWTTPNMEPAIAGADVQRTVGQEWALDVVHPVESSVDGWPIVVVFHGSTAGSVIFGGDMKDVARQGAVVVAPRWAPPAWSAENLKVLSAEEYIDGYWFDVGGCALSAAQEVAIEYGGDPARTTVVGFSAGVHPTAWTALGLARNNLCPDREPFTPPTGMVAGDAHWLFQGGNWDEDFRDPESLAANTVERFLDPSLWRTLPAEFTAYLWSTESLAWNRSIENPPAEDSWLQIRVGHIPGVLEDLESVGAFDDAVLLFPDNGLLLAWRLEGAGVTVLHESFSTDHNYAAPVYDRIVEVMTGAPFSESP